MVGLFKLVLHGGVWRPWSPQDLSGCATLHIVMLTAQPGGVLVAAVVIHSLIFACRLRWTILWGVNRLGIDLLLLLISLILADHRQIPQQS